MGEATYAISNLVQKLIGYAMEYGLKVIGVIIFLIIALIIAGWARGLVRRSMERRNIDPALTGFFASLVRWMILIAAFIGALGVFGVETTSFAAVLGGASLAIGLAFQGSLGNFSAGVMLLIFRPFTVGDIVSTGGVTGKCVEIGLFTITLDTPDNRRIIVPNGAVFGETIENITYHDVRRVDVAVGVDYGSDLNVVRQVLEKAAASVKNQVPDREPQIFLDSLGGSSIDFQVRVWNAPAGYWDTWQETTQAVYEHLNEAGIGIPFPQMDVHVDGSVKQG